MPALNTEELCTPTCRCRRCVELLHERAMRKRRASHSRRAGRVGGVASGVARRRLAHKRRGNKPGPNTRSLALTYELRRLSRREFDELYLKAFPLPERPTALASYERCREAVWQHVGSLYALLAVQGQHCKTTQPRRRVGLAHRGVTRCVRTLYSYNRRLEAMGIAKVIHYKTPPGKLDCLSVEWHVTRRLTCRVATPTENPFLRKGGSPPQSTATALVPPPTAADLGPPDKPAELPVTDDEQHAARVRFLQLRLRFPFGDLAPIEAELAQLSGQARDRICSRSSRGFR